LVAYALLGRGKMADGKGDATAAAGAGAGAEAPAVAGAEVETESMARGHRPASPASGAPGLRPCLWQLETELREQEVSEVSSLSYCRSFCQVRGGLDGRGWRGGEAGRRDSGSASTAGGFAGKNATPVSRRAPGPGRPSSAVTRLQSLPGRIALGGPEPRELPARAVPCRCCLGPGRVVGAPLPP
jgi:hypothetical protein